MPNCPSLNSSSYLDKRRPDLSARKKEINAVLIFIAQVSAWRAKKKANKNVEQ